MSLSTRQDDHSGSDEDEMDWYSSGVVAADLQVPFVWRKWTLQIEHSGRVNVVIRVKVCCFCWNNIRQNLNGKCPACRRPYEDRPIEFTPVTQTEFLNDQRRQQKINEEKKRKEREKREMEVMNRKHLASVRVQQKNLVYVTGLIPKIQNEELEQTLRSHEYFGQYGKILKVVVNNRNTTGQRNQANSQRPVQVYITFAKKEDAAKAILAVDGSINDGKVLHASLGTTKYCTAYLRNQPCQNPNCMYLHEPGEEADSYSYSREDFSSLQHAMKQNEQKQRVKNLRPAAMEQSPSDNAGDYTPLPAKVSWATNKLSRSNTPVLTEPVDGSPLKKSNEVSPPGARVLPAKLKQSVKSPQKMSGKFRFSKPAASSESHFGAFEKTLATLCDGPFQYVFASAVLASDEFRNAQSMPPLFTYSKDAATRKRREAESAKAVMVDRGFDPFDGKRHATKTPLSYHTQMNAPPLGVSQLPTANYPRTTQFQQPLSAPTYKTAATPPPGIFSPPSYNELPRQTSREGVLRDQIYAPQARRTDGMMNDRARLDLQNRPPLTRSELVDPAILSMRPSPLPQQGFIQQDHQPPLPAPLPQSVTTIRPQSTTSLNTESSIATLENSNFPTKTTQPTASLTIQKKESGQKPKEEKKSTPPVSSPSAVRDLSRVAVEDHPPVPARRQKKGKNHTKTPPRAISSSAVSEVDTQSGISTPEPAKDITLNVITSLANQIDFRSHPFFKKPTSWSFTFTEQQLEVAKKNLEPMVDGTKVPLEQLEREYHAALKHEESIMKRLEKLVKKNSKLVGLVH